jgi:peptidoglycan/xylan/chitin deacetylase (PgdA/CDA1 family)
MEKTIKAAVTLALFERTPMLARRLFPQAIWSLPKGVNEIFLTFDDGPHPTFTGNLLELLDAQQARATFFLVGEKVKKHPQLVREIVAAGHAIGNHTLHHRQLRWQRRAVVHEEIKTAQHILEDCTNASIRYFRPPYGALSPAIFSVTNEANLAMAMWSLMPGDVWRANHPQAIAASMMNHARDGEIILLHDGHACAPATIAALRETLPKLKERGYQFAVLPND